MNLSETQILPKIYPQVKNILHFDGCSKGNPGKAGIGAVIYCDEQEIYAGSEYIGTRTNNEAEYMALILGLKEALLMKIDELIVCGDSLLVVRQMKGEYKVSSDKLLNLYTTAKYLLNKFKYIEFRHVYRQFNKRADTLANIAVNTHIDTDDEFELPNIIKNNRI